jgi:peptide/nickel transport system ATP-binding protein
MIFQDPLTALHPFYSIGRQIGEAYRIHHDVSKQEARAKAIEMLDRVGIPQPDRRVDDYPHQFSGGMRQRAMIAMALVNNPDLLIADEPTTALDVTVQAQIIELIDRIKREFNIGVILITHDLGVVAEVAQTVMVMYAGRSMEAGPTRPVFAGPLHPYTWGLLESLPHVGDKASRLVPIEGAPPSLIFVPPGCPFHPRCPHKFDRCSQEIPEFRDRGGGHPEACHLSGEDKRRIWSERLARRQRVTA